MQLDARRARDHSIRGCSASGGVREDAGNGTPRWRAWPWREVSWATRRRRASKRPPWKPASRGPAAERHTPSRSALRPCPRLPSGAGAANVARFSSPFLDCHCVSIATVFRYPRLGVVTRVAQAFSRPHRITTPLKNSDTYRLFGLMVAAVSPMFRIHPYGSVHSLILASSTPLASESTADHQKRPRSGVVALCLPLLTGHLLRARRSPGRIVPVGCSTSD